MAPVNATSVAKTIASALGVGAAIASRAVTPTPETSTVAPAGGVMSPVTLTHDWSRAGRLLLLTGLSFVGCIGNIFMISSVMIEDHLKKRGNAFVVNIALADLLVTGLIYPASIVILLAGFQDEEDLISWVCDFQWILARLSLLVTLLTMAGIAVENFARLCLPPQCYAWLTARKITTFLLMIWAVATSVVIIQTVMELGPDYCQRKFSGTKPFMLTFAVVLMGLPILVALMFYLETIVRVRHVRAQPGFMLSSAFFDDYELMKTNLISFLLFVVFWMPFVVVVGLSVGSNDVSQNVYYHLAWIALSKSSFSNFLYCATNRHFRCAYISLFYYLFCKTALTLARRPRRNEVYLPSGDIRVHIIQGMNMNATHQRTTRQASLSSVSSGSGPSTVPPRRCSGGRVTSEL